MNWNLELFVVGVLFAWRATYVSTSVSTPYEVDPSSGPSCPSGATGQFPFPPDCRKFINCWKGRGAVTMCAPGTLFNAATLECDFPYKVVCGTSSERYTAEVPTYSASDRRKLGYGRTPTGHAGVQPPHDPNYIGESDDDCGPQGYDRTGRKCSENPRYPGQTQDELFGAGSYPRPAVYAPRPPDGFRAHQVPQPEPNCTQVPLFTPFNSDDPTLPSARNGPYSPQTLSSPCSPDSQSPIYTRNPQSLEGDSGPRQRTPKVPQVPWTWPKHTDQRQDKSIPPYPGHQGPIPNQRYNTGHPDCTPGFGKSLYGCPPPPGPQRGPPYPLEPPPPSPFGQPPRYPGPPPPGPITGPYGQPPGQNPFESRSQSAPNPGQPNFGQAPFGQIPEGIPPPGYEQRPQSFPNPGQPNFGQNPFGQLPERVLPPGQNPYERRPNPQPPNFGQRPDGRPVQQQPGQHPYEQRPVNPQQPFGQFPDGIPPPPGYNPFEQSPQNVPNRGQPAFGQNPFGQLPERVPTSPDQPPSQNPYEQRPEILPPQQRPGLPNYPPNFGPIFTQRPQDGPSSQGNPYDHRPKESQPRPGYPDYNPNIQPHGEQPPRQVQQFATDGRPTCPRGYSGLQPHPTDCTKFLNCDRGKTYIMNCNPRTKFNPRTSMCDHPDKVSCDQVESISQPSQDLEPDPQQNPGPVYQSPERSRDLNLDSSWSPSSRQPSVIETTTRPATIQPRTQDAGWLPKGARPQESTARPILANPQSPSPYLRGFYIPSQDQELDREPIGSESLKSENYTPLANRFGDSPEDKAFGKDDKPDKSQHVFRPHEVVPTMNNTKTEDDNPVKWQLFRLRGGPSPREGFLEVQASQGVWRIVCDADRRWSRDIANSACNHLGYSRGCDDWWFGNPAGKSLTQQLVDTSYYVECSNKKDSISDCHLDEGDRCEVGRDGVWVRCMSNPVSQCGPGETHFDGNCYLLVEPKEDKSFTELVGFSQGEALSHCQSNGGHLLDITSQKENDYISEWLVVRPSVDSVMTSGVGVSVMGSPLWIWEGSANSFSWHNWWPGWKGGPSIAPKTTTGRALCVVIKRQFPCAGLKTNNISSEARLCDAGYYFWHVEDCGSMSTVHPYVCKRPAKKVGCIIGRGESYRGPANVTETSTICTNWDSPDVVSAIKYKISADQLKTLSGHNYCRNPGGSESKPWCYVKKEGILSKELCDIPPCDSGVEKYEADPEYKCRPNLFPCRTHDNLCIPSEWTCDGKQDCPNGLDEQDCDDVLRKYSKIPSKRIVGNDLENWIDTPLVSCAYRCMEAQNCKSFTYSESINLCVLTKSNVGLSGLRNDPAWDYYELNSRSVRCGRDQFVCDNGKCLNQYEVCDGFNGCGDRSDERNCSWLDLGIELRFAPTAAANHQATNVHQGIVQIKVNNSWGLICDDEFDLQDAHVICRQLGFPMGAAKFRKHSEFESQGGFPGGYLVDNLKCTGNESNITECDHNGWGIHDCGPGEAVGVECLSKSGDDHCPVDQWRCASSEECIPLKYLCDGVEDCQDKSDEQPNTCQAPEELRLSGMGGGSDGSRRREGRVELRKYGVWGTVCDDGFGDREATVVCRQLGWPGAARAVKGAAFGPGSGPIWMDQVSCQGNESSLAECKYSPWESNDCKHNEDVAVICSAFTELKSEALRAPRKLTPSRAELLSEECGVVRERPGSSRLTQANPGWKGEHPWQASIRARAPNGPDSYWCGAAIITRYHVLTASYCLKDYLTTSYFVRAGDFHPQIVEGTEQDLAMDEIWFHSGSQPNIGSDSGLALIKVKEPGFVFSDHISPVCLPSPITAYYPGTNCSVPGWGSTGTRPMGSIETTKVRIIRHEHCQNGQQQVRGNEFCAEVQGTASLNCQGDVGAPVLCPYQGRTTLFGVRGRSQGCDRPNPSRTYNKIASYLDWIMETLDQ